MLHVTLRGPQVTVRILRAGSGAVHQRQRSSIASSLLAVILAVKMPYSFSELCRTSDPLEPFRPVGLVKDGQNRMEVGRTRHRFWSRRRQTLLALEAGWARIVTREWQSAPSRISSLEPKRVIGSPMSVCLSRRSAQPPAWPLQCCKTEQKPKTRFRNLRFELGAAYGIFATAVRSNRGLLPLSPTSAGKSAEADGGK